MEKNNTEVLIGGQVFTMSGFEEREYLQKIALYINQKLQDVERIPGYNHMNTGMKQTLLAVNIADDLFKSMDQLSEKDLHLEKNERELYELRHEVVTGKKALEEAKKEIEELKKKNSELNVKMEVSKLQNSTANRNSGSRKN